MGVRNYHSGESKSVQLAMESKQIKMLRELGEEARQLAAAVKNNNLGQLRIPSHDTKTPTILSHKARILREQQSNESGSV